MTAKGLVRYGVPKEVSEKITNQLDTFNSDLISKMEIWDKINDAHNCLAHSNCDKEHYDKISSLLIEAKLMLRPVI